MSEAKKAICEAPKKEGESVHLMMVQLDAAGQAIGEESWSHYGYDNSMANEITTLIIETLNELARALNELKNPGDAEAMKIYRDTLAKREK